MKVTMKIFIFLNIILNVFCVSVSYSAETQSISNKVCLLSFLEKEHIFNDMIEDSLAKFAQQSVIFLKEAKPSDLIRCFREGATEISIIAHSVKIIENNNWMNLVYFDRGQFRPVSQQGLKSFIDLLQAQQPRVLRHFRIISCSAEQVLARYNLRVTLNELGIGVEIQDISILAKLLNGFEDVTILDHRWLAESFQGEGGAESGGDSDSEVNGDRFNSKKIYFYIHANTLFLYQFGSRDVLRGRYSVELNGVAIGLEEKWKMFWLDKNEIKNLKIGETKTFWVQTLSFAFNLGVLGFELQAQGDDQFQSPISQSDTNALGVSVSLATQIAITRNY
jgi:hypothetical protein